MRTVPHPPEPLLRILHLRGWFLVALTVIACQTRATRVVVGEERAETEDVLEQFVAWRLAPAQVAPPTLTRRTALATTPDVSGTVELLLAEDEPWNQWPGRTARLFNNRAAHLFQVELVADGPITWLPERTQLELNEPGNVLRPAASQEELLEELLFWAYHQERQVLEGDLVERTRAAGALRDAYLPRSANDGMLTGILAFPLEITPETERFLGDGDPADYHVVAMRLTLGLIGPDGRQQLVFELE
jgi:hypothetical protein